MSIDGERKGHAFISYVREDSLKVDRLQAILEAAGVRVWRDTEDLWPGEDWRSKIQGAITDDALAFIACFSDNSAAREKTYQNEELVLAVAQLRLRRPDQTWLFPVRFSDCAIPEFDLGGGRTLSSLQSVDLFGSWDQGAARLLAGVLRVLDGDNTVPGTGRNTAPAVTKFMKTVLLDDSRQIELEDFVSEITDEVVNELEDVEQFPTRRLLNKALSGS